MNDFVALIVPGSRPDYNNNGIDSAVSTALLINSPIYVGGVSEQHSGAHFNDPNEIGVRIIILVDFFKYVVICYPNYVCADFNYLRLEVL